MRASLKGRHSTKGGRTRHRVHSKPKTHKGAAVKDSGSNTDSLDLSNYCPSDLILKRIYLRRTATAHSFTVGRPRTTPFAARAELLVIVSVLSCCSACPNQHVNESACSELKLRGNSAKTSPIEDHNFPLNSVTSHIIYVLKS